MSKYSCLFLVLLGTAMVQANPSQNREEDSWGESGEQMVKAPQPLVRQKRGGYIAQQKVAGYSSGLRGPAAGLRGAGYSKGLSGGGGGYSSGLSSGGGYSSGLSAGGSLPGPRSLYSYAPRRANAAVYGGIHGPQTSEEALKFDSHLTRSMIADALASSGRQLYAGHGGVISAAIQSRRNIQFYDVPSNRDVGEPLTIEVGASPSSQLNLRFKSASSALVVDQDHESAPGSFRETSSEDEPHRVVHTVTRPIFQEVHEVIKPFRRITQEIQPIQEDIQTIVAKGDDIATGTVDGIVSGVQLTGGSAEDDGAALGGQIIQSARPSFGTGLVSGGGRGGSALSGPTYSSGYIQPMSKPSLGGYRSALSAGHRMPSGYGGQSAGYGGQSAGYGGPSGAFQQMQIPFRRAASAAARAARRA